MAKKERETAMISSTSLDLPEHRKQVVEACLRAGVFPSGMEQLPARDASGVHVSLEMVDQADIYIGVYAWRYGWVPDIPGVPNPDKISITEMEFNRALERKQSGELKDILIFVMHDKHPVTKDDVEADAVAQEKLKKFKDRASAHRVRLAFSSAEELRGLVLQSLTESLRRIEEAKAKPGEPTKLDLHPPNIIPNPPEPYIAHPYSLLQTKDVVGRQTELNLLTDWVTVNKEVPADTRIFSLVAIGGMGKSALTWKWFNDIAPNELPKLAGRMWWSFYESDAHWENFIIRALAYVSGQSEKTVREMTSPDREDQFWRLLDQQPFLLVLDGLERILLAYARMDAAQMLDDDLDEQTANRVAKMHGLPESASQSFIGKHQLRCTANQRAGQFLRRLARVRQSRVLITTRLYPAELQADTGSPLPSCSAIFLRGLKDDDALNLWREFRVSGSREELLPLFRSFGNYPLLLRALAGEVAEYHPGPGNFDQWRKDNPGFNPAGLPLKTAKTHVLEYALRGLGETQRKVLHTLAAFRMPATWDTLRALLVAPVHRLQAALTTRDNKGTVERAEAFAPKPCADHRALDAVLTELEDRGLMGWDKQANRYDLHPIVRAVVWHALSGREQHDLYAELHAHFDALPKPSDWKIITKLDELAPAIELFHTLIGLERLEEAIQIFRSFLDLPTWYRLAISRQRVELLERLFPRDERSLPMGLSPESQFYVLDSLGTTYALIGELDRAIRFIDWAVDIADRNRLRGAEKALLRLVTSLRFKKHLRPSTTASRKALRFSRELQDHETELLHLARLGLTLAICNQPESQIVLHRALVICTYRDDKRNEGLVCAYIAARCLWMGQSVSAIEYAKRGWNLAFEERRERDFIRTARLHGVALLGLNQLGAAEERLQHSLTRAREVCFVEEELPALAALAEVHRQRRDCLAARELLEQVWAPAERGPYPLFHADALNVLAQIERDQGNPDAATAAATNAYALAWCDGPPYAYHYGLTNARKHLQELGAPEPQLPPFDESKFELMPDVELNPKDEFWVDPEKLDL